MVHSCKNDLHCANNTGEEAIIGLIICFSGSLLQQGSCFSCVHQCSCDVLPEFPQWG